MTRVLGQPVLAPERWREAHATLHLLPMESSVLAGVRRGDARATRAVYDAYGRLVYVVAHRVLGDDELAEEATRLTFVRAWQAAGGLDIHRDPSPWLARIAKRCAIEIHRREVRNGEPPAYLASVATLDALAALWKVRRVIDALPRAERTVLRMQHREGLTLDEIAMRLDLPLATVTGRSRRAHGLLARLLGHLREPIT